MIKTPAWVPDTSCIHAADAGELNSCKVRLSFVHEFQALNLNKEMQFHHKRKFKNRNGIFIFLTKPLWEFRDRGSCSVIVINMNI